MEEQRIIRLSILDQPMHRSQHVLLGWNAHRIVLIIRKTDHILPSVAEAGIQVCGHVLDVVDTASKLTLGTEVVDADKQSLPSACTLRVLKVVSLRSSVGESLCAGRWWWRGCMVACIVGVLIDRRKTRSAIEHRPLTRRWPVSLSHGWRRLSLLAKACSTEMPSYRSISSSTIRARGRRPLWRIVVVSLLGRSSIVSMIQIPVDKPTGSCCSLAGEALQVVDRSHIAAVAVVHRTAALEADSRVADLGRDSTT